MKILKDADGLIRFPGGKDAQSAQCEDKKIQEKINYAELKNARYLNFIRTQLRKLFHLLKAAQNPTAETRTPITAKAVHASIFCSSNIKARMKQGKYYRGKVKAAQNLTAAIRTQAPENKIQMLMIDST